MLLVDLAPLNFGSLFFDKTVDCIDYPLANHNRARTLQGILESNGSRALAVIIAVFAFVFKKGYITIEVVYKENPQETSDDQTIAFPFLTKTKIFSNPVSINNSKIKKLLTILLLKRALQMIQTLNPKSNLKQPEQKTAISYETSPVHSLTRKMSRNNIKKANLA